MLDVDLRHFGSCLREARLAHGTNGGMSVRELSMLTEVTESTLRAYEYGNLS